MSTKQFWMWQRNEDGTFYVRELISKAGSVAALTNKKDERLMMDEAEAREMMEYFACTTYKWHVTSELHTDVMSRLRLMHSMRDMLPDGQWEDGPEELYEEIKECRPSPFNVEFWQGAKEELDRNEAWWI